MTCSAESPPEDGSLYILEYTADVPGMFSGSHFFRNLKLFIVGVFPRGCKTITPPPPRIASPCGICAFMGGHFDIFARHLSCCHHWELIGYRRIPCMELRRIRTRVMTSLVICASVFLFYSYSSPYLVRSSFVFRAHIYFTHYNPFRTVVPFLGPKTGLQF